MSEKKHHPLDHGNGLHHGPDQLVQMRNPACGAGCDTAIAELFRLRKFDLLPAKVMQPYLRLHSAINSERLAISKTDSAKVVADLLGRCIQSCRYASLGL